MDLTPTSEEEICRIMYTFKESSPGWDAISAKIKLYYINLLYHLYHYH